MDTDVIAVRLQKLDEYLQGLCEPGDVRLDDYLEIDSTIVHRNLTEELDDFEQFAQQIVARFFPEP